MGIPVIGFSAWSGTGKTGVMEAVIRHLSDRGYRVGVVKHDAHGFEMDRPGKDSWRHRKAGAETVTLTGPGRTAVIREREESLEDCLAEIRDVDLILVEGFRHADIPRIGLSRLATGKGLPELPENYIALVTDDAGLKTDGPRFAFEDTEGLACWIEKEILNVEEKEFTHFNDQGRARMVDVGEKKLTERVAVAAGRVLVNRETFDKIRNGGVKKGDVLTVAQVAGIMGAKHTPDWIPMCHPVPLTGIDLRLTLDENRLSVEIEARAECVGRTGVEMEALTAVSCAALTVYDMCKALQRDMVIEDIRLLRKTGGIHGDYEREERKHD